MWSRFGATGALRRPSKPFFGGLGERQRMHHAPYRTFGRPSCVGLPHRLVLLAFCGSEHFISSDLPIKLTPAGATRLHPGWGAGGTNLPKSTKARNWGGRSAIRTHDPEWAPLLPPSVQAFDGANRLGNGDLFCSASPARAALFGVEWIRNFVCKRRTCQDQ